MPVAPSEKTGKKREDVTSFGKASQNFSQISERATLFSDSPTTQDLIDAIQDGYTILIEGKNLKSGLKDFEGPAGDLALSLTTLTAYIIDITAVLDHFLLHKTFLHPVLCEQILTSTHEVITNAILWSNLEVDCPNKRQKSLNFCDLIKERLKNKILARRLLKINLHINPNYVDVVIISKGKGFDWNRALSNVSSTVQGLAIIHSFADKIIADDEGRTLTLRFNT